VNQPTPCKARISSVRGSVRVLFYICDKLHMTTGERDKMRTMRNVPDRSRMVKSAGTAIVVDGKVRVRPN
jgi:hypothetical protein